MDKDIIKVMLYSITTVTNASQNTSCKPGTVSTYQMWTQTSNNLYRAVGNANSISLSHPTNHYSQTLSTNLFNIDVHEWLVIRNCYKKTVWWIFPLQWNSAKVISILKNYLQSITFQNYWFLSLGPQLSTTFFAELTDTWKFEHVIMLSHNTHTSDFAKSMFQVVKVHWHMPRALDRIPIWCYFHIVVHLLTLITLTDWAHIQG